MAEANRFPPIDWLWREYRRNAAWYSGDTRELTATAPNTCKTLWRSDEEIKFHVPIAADISAMAASMVFSESPIIATEHERTQERIDEVAQKANIYNVLLQAAELASAYGGVFLKWTWNADDGFPRLFAVPADAGLPDWVAGKLNKIVFWNTVRVDESDGRVWRLEETYTADGHILSRLMRGDAANLGMEEPLESIPETVGIIPDANSGTDMLLATYVPNMLPNRERPYVNFGRSDYEGLYGLFDALDEAYSSIQREMRFTKTTVIVPMEYLRRKNEIFGGLEAETGAPRWEFSNNSGAFTALDIDSRNTASPINVVNPELRSASRLEVCEHLVRQILSFAGYAPQSAGIDINGSAESGTALTVRERKSLRTTEAKKTYWWHALQTIIRAFLALDAKVYRSGVDMNAEITIEMPTNTQPDIAQMAEILEQLERAGAISTEAKVRLLHPDWSDDKVNEEVNRIKLEKGLIGDDPLDERLGDTENPTPETVENETDDAE